MFAWQLHTGAGENSARAAAFLTLALGNIVLIVDTLKKFVELMSKGGARLFFSLMRALTQRGATVILLGHTNKHRGPDGKLVFEGVGDVRADVDERDLAAVLSG